MTDDTEEERARKENGGQHEAPGKRNNNDIEESEEGYRRGYVEKWGEWRLGMELGPRATK